MHILFRKIQRTQTDPVFLPNNSDTGNGTGNRMDVIDKEEKKERHRVRRYSSLSFFSLVKLALNSACGNSTCGMFFVCLN